MGEPVAFVAALVIASSQVAAASGATVAVSVVDTAGALAPAEIVVQPVGTLGGSAIVRTVSAPEGWGSVRLESGLWRVTARATKRWCWPVQVLVRSDTAEPTTVRLVLFPVGRMAGSFNWPDRERLPTKVGVHIRRDYGPRPLGSVEREPSVESTLQGSPWQCEVPAGIPFDVQLYVEGFAPVYLWNIRVAEQATHATGSLPMFRGSSLTGWVISDDGSAPRVTARVELTAPDGEPLRDSGNKHFRFSGPTNSRGFFQLGPVPPGAYHVVASADVRITEAAFVQIPPNTEHRLNDPLRLKPPVTLRLSVSPTTDPDGRPWSVRLLALRGQHSGHMVVPSEPVSDVGTWSKSGLAAGEYRLFLRTETGDVWYYKVIDLKAGYDDSNEVSIQILRLVGTISIGEQPLEARIVLADDQSHVQVAFASDKQGEFSDYFPRVDFAAGRWSAIVRSSRSNVTLSGIKAELVNESEARVVIGLPDGTLEGSVVNEDGAPQDALVLVDEYDVSHPDGIWLASAQVRTEGGTGKFRIGGLRSGKYRAHARGAAGAAMEEQQSDVAAVAIDEGGAATAVRLVLKQADTISGRVTDAFAVGVPGAQVAVVPTASPDLPIRVHSTDATGRFSTKIPVGTKHVVITAGAIGVGRRMMGGPVPNDGRDLTIELDPFGGTLVLNAQGAVSAIDEVYVCHDGGFESLQMLARWSAQNGQAADGSAFRIPLMAPGTYRVCRVPSITDYFALVGGTLPKDRCNEGDLPPSGDLQLQIPAGQVAR